MGTSNRASMLAQMLSEAEAEKERLQQENDDLRRNHCKRSPDDDREIAGPESAGDEPPKRNPPRPGQVRPRPQ